jgi:hypothetical protein
MPMQKKLWLALGLSLAVVSPAGAQVVGGVLSATQCEMG